MTAHQPCAYCDRFTIADYPTEAAGGMGRCTGFDNPGEPVKFVPHDGQPCVLFLRAKNERQRRAFVDRQRKITEAA